MGSLLNFLCFSSVLPIRACFVLPFDLIHLHWTLVACCPLLFFSLLFPDGAFHLLAVGHIHLYRDRLFSFLGEDIFSHRLCFLKLDVQNGGYGALVGEFPGGCFPNPLSPP